MASGVVGGVVDTDVPAVHALASFGIARAVLSLGGFIQTRQLRMRLVYAGDGAFLLFDPGQGGVALLR